MVELLLRPAGFAALAERVRDRSLHSPAVLDLEVTHTVRRLCALRQVAEALGHQAIADLQELALRRYPHAPMLARIWELRATLTPYDAAYVALAESLDAPLITRDRRLARARGHRARIELV